jgi:diaminohydroxyphosphoribosylaminopyrimidine deaminase/5-amino-6-(5-phosphoribosylamino)uracil reductase
MDDRFFMKRAIRLAEKGTGKVSPNPRVGAVIVKNGKVLAEGYHAFFGGPHAEADVLSKVGFMNAEGSTLYINLEPCDHRGKTPPCTDAIIRSGIARVVVGTMDVNPLVAGRGVRKLKRAGIDVRMGVLEDECRQLNEAFFKYISCHRPFITLKIAQTLDGKIATLSGRSRWITNEASRKVVHRLRKNSDAVLVGIQTVLADDPELNVRNGGSVQPRRIVLDSHLRIPLDSKLIRLNSDGKTIVATVSYVSKQRVRKIQKMGADVWILKGNTNGRVNLRSLAKKAVSVGITSILVEGGKEVFTSFLKSNLVDKMIVFVAPKLFGRGIDAFGDLGIADPSEAVQFQSVAWKRIGSDWMMEGRP